MNLDECYCQAKYRSPSQFGRWMEKHNLQLKSITLQNVALLNAANRRWKRGFWERLLCSTCEKLFIPLLADNHHNDTIPSYNLVWASTVYGFRQTNLELHRLLLLLLVRTLNSLKSIRVVHSAKYKGTIYHELWGTGIPFMRCISAWNA